MFISTWKTLTAAGDTTEATITYANDLEAAVDHHRILFGTKPVPGAPQPGDYVHGRLDINRAVFADAWHIVDDDGQLDPITIDHLTARLTPPLMNELTRALD